jgi:hypothetical protein
MHARLSSFLMMAFLASLASPAAAAVNFPGSYSQDFDTLASTGTIAPWADNTTIAGWYSTRLIYRIGAGTDNTGDLYSFGNAGSGERALGSIASNATSEIQYAVELLNTSGATITEIVVSYTGEQWRQGGSAGTQPPPSLPQFLIFEYGSASPATWPTASFTGVPALNFTSPIFGPTSPSALDGNAAPNRTGLSATISGLSWLPGQTLWLRWRDPNDDNNDHGLAIDNLQVTAVPEPASLAMFAVGAVGIGAALRRRKRLV